MWINLGPLTYHWAKQVDLSMSDERYSRSVELSWEELEYAIKAAGFKFGTNSPQWKKCYYSSNAKSMLRSEYTCVLFTATKASDDSVSTGST